LKVFIVNRGCHDYSKAQEFGTLVVMSEGSFSRFATGKIFREFEKSVKSSEPEDLILVSGLTIMTAIAVGMFAVRHGKVNLLLHNQNPGQDEVYVKRTIDFGGLRDGHY
jgi:hypothetical protein